MSLIAVSKPTSNRNTLNALVSPYPLKGNFGVVILYDFKIKPASNNHWIAVSNSRPLALSFIAVNTNFLFSLAN